MARAIDDLWPDDLAQNIEQVPPVTILKQQAALLGQRTKNVIEGDVETKTDISQRLLHHTFYIVAPALDFYRYPLLIVEHPVTEMYPATIANADSPKRKIPTKDEKLFKKMLKALFATEKTKTVISALLAQSTEQEQIKIKIRKT